MRLKVVSMGIYDTDQETVTLKIKRIEPEAIIPEYKTKGACGMDICALNGGMIYPGGIGLVKTGLMFEIPEGYEVQIRPRSGLALKHGVTVLNSPGTIDSDYRGPIGVILVNHGTEKFKFEAGERIAQIVLSKAYQAKIEVVAAVNETERGEGGFGSTGTK